MTWKTLRTPTLAGCIAMLLSLAPAAGEEPATPGDPWHTELASAVAEAGGVAGKNGFLLVDLYAEWCGWCKKLERDVFHTPKFLAFADGYALLRADTEDGGEGSNLKSRFQAESLPTTLILTAGGSLVGKVHGYHPTGRMIDEIERQVGAYERLVEGFDRWKTSSEVAILNTMAKEFHDRFDGARAAELYRHILEIVPAGSGEATWLRFRLADALRLYGRFAAANEALAAARAGTADQELLEQVDLLGIRIAQDMGDCSQTSEILERFLQTHPQSSFVPFARRSLKEQHCT